MRDATILIDGPNLYHAAKALDLEIDFKALKTHFGVGRNLIRSYYYTATYSDADDYQSIRPLIDWLGYNGYTVKTKPSKLFTDAEGRKTVKGNMDVDITVDAIVAASWSDEIILFTGDGDFRPLVEHIQQTGTRVTVVSTMKTSPSMIADELRRQTDEFIDLSDVSSAFTKPRRLASSGRRVA